MLVIFSSFFQNTKNFFFTKITIFLDINLCCKFISLEELNKAQVWMHSGDVCTLVHIPDNVFADLYYWADL